MASSPRPTCALADSKCEGRMEWHHAIGQNRLKRTFPFGAWRTRYSDEAYRPVSRTMQTNWLEVVTLSLILGDKRNRIWLCKHHHELVTNGRVRVEPTPKVWSFAEEYGLTGQLENDLARRAT